MIWYRLIVLLVYLISNCVAPDPQTSASQNTGQNTGSSTPAGSSGNQNPGSSNQNAEEDLKPKITQAQKEEWQEEIDKLKVSLYLIYEI